MMKAHLRSLLTSGGLVAALMFPATSTFAVSLDYTFTGQFFAGSFLDGTLIDGTQFEVHIFTDTTIPDNDPGDSERGEFLGPFNARIIIDGFGTYSFVNPIDMITEWIDAVGFQPVENVASFGGGSTSSMTGFSPDTIAPFFGDPNVLDPFPGGANVVIASFINEPVTLLGTTDILILDGESPGGSVRATTIPDSGSTLVLFSMVIAGLAAYRGPGRRVVA
jgi:hypothetical protein